VKERRRVDERIERITKERFVSPSASGRRPRPQEELGTTSDENAQEKSYELAHQKFNLAPKYDLTRDSCCSFNPVRHIA